MTLFILYSPISRTRAPSRPRSTICTQRNLRTLYENRSHRYVPCTTVTDFEGCPCSIQCGSISGPFAFRPARTSSLSYDNGRRFAPGNSPPFYTVGACSRDPCRSPWWTFLGFLYHHCASSNRLCNCAVHDVARSARHGIDISLYCSIFWERGDPFYPGDTE